MFREHSHRRRALIAGLAGGAVLAGCGERRVFGVANGGVRRYGGSTMGTSWTLKVAWGNAAAIPDAVVRDAVQAALEGVDRRMSLYRPDSELSAFNRHPSGRPFEASADLARVLGAAAEISDWSAGAFDVTVAPLVQAWGFGAEPRRGVPPRAVIVAEQREVGYRGIRVDAPRGAVTKASGGIQADLGGIAKGYGLDAAAAELDALGVASYMLEVGGEVRTRGVNGVGLPWRIGVEQPDASPRRARLVVPLSGLSMATSGDYRTFFEQDGRRYSHALDPRRGRPVEHELCSVTVVAGDCMRADALATALIVLGPERGAALAESAGIAAYFVTRTAPGRYRDGMTRAFAALRPLRA